MQGLKMGKKDACITDEDVNLSCFLLYPVYAL